MNKQITRIAPSPSGKIHLGTIRTAYFNYLSSKQSSGEFILRIDDTDENRSKQEHTELIYKTMEWIGLDYNLTFKQSERLDIYRDFANNLLKNNLATKDGDLIRFTPDKNYMDNFNSWKDEISGEIKVTEEDKKVINNMIIMKTGNLPVYHFASVVDDYLFNINHIIRGTDHIMNSPRQIALFNAIGCKNNIKFSHIGLIFKDKKKMSKRDDVSGIDYYIENKYNPEAILNGVLRLGWAPSDANFDQKTPLINKQLAEKIFLTEGKMKNSPSNFDVNKLNWYNKKYNTCI